MAEKLSKKAKVKKVEKVAEVIGGSFTLDQLIMKGMAWTAKMSVGLIMPKSYHKYSAVMLFNEDPYESQVKRLEEKIVDVQRTNKNRLFNDTKNEEIADLKEDIKDVQRDMAEAKRQCATIEFVAVVESLKYVGTDTKLEMRIPDNVIEPINKVKMMLTYYKIELSPIV